VAAGGIVEPGLLIMDKPAGLTSHDVVARVRRILATRAVGHAGTLDPMATGVLVLGVGRATKLLGHLALDDKAYLATIRLGVSTTTDDAEGEPLRRERAGGSDLHTGGSDLDAGGSDLDAGGSDLDAGAVERAAIEAGMAGLTGRIEQVPSTVSAIKVGGRRAYALARGGEPVALAARPVTVSRFDLLDLRRGDGVTDLDVLVECSTGTYVRALARDLGAALRVGGHLTALRRTRVGPFGLDRAGTLAELEALPRVSLTLDEAVAAAFPRRDVDAAAARDLSHGRPLPPAGVAGTLGVFGPDGRAVGLVAERDGAARAVVVLRPAAGGS
jgi:tRNA pseudouridine55 synthase